jgi:hypothetical protein
MGAFNKGTCAAFFSMLELEKRAIHDRAAEDAQRYA